MSLRVAVLCGGVGGAKLAHGLQLGLEPGRLTAIVNTADDLELHGLHISPDLDTVMYTLAGRANRATGWGVRDETWSAADMLARYGQPTWFGLGDRDLATHVVRTSRLREGQRLTEVTTALAAGLGIRTLLLPMSDDRVRTRVRTDVGWLDFQTYFVERGHVDDVRELRFEGLEAAGPTPEVLAAVEEAEVIVLAPSNPFVSLGPILGLPGLAEAVRGARAPVVGVSPIIGGSAVRGPADRMFVTLGGEASALGVARHYAEQFPGLVDGWLIDTVDGAQAPAIEALDLRVRATGTLMASDDDRRRVAAEVLTLATAPAPAAR
ncbi:MAG: 2-phospho-L-lactate transferase [Candidatus Limnocylindrales bacterium]